jgi:hypothetical protein
VDVGFLQHPELLFRQPSYHRTGALFFRDRTFPGVCQETWRVLAMITDQPSEQIQQSRVLKNISSHEMESGLIVVDQSRAFPGIIGACKLMDRLSREYLYNKCCALYGDKEFYWLGFEMTNQEYSLSKWYAGNLGVMRDHELPRGIEHTAKWKSRKSFLQMMLSQGQRSKEDRSDQNPENPDSENVVNILGPMQMLRQNVLEAPERQVEVEAKEEIETRICGRMLHFDDQGVPLWWNGGFHLQEEADNTENVLERPLLPLEMFDDGGSVEDNWQLLPQWDCNGETSLFCKNPGARNIRKLPEDLRLTAEESLRTYKMLRFVNQTEFLREHL